MGHIGVGTQIRESTCKMLGKWIISLLMRLGVWGVLLFQLVGFYRYRFGAQFNVAFAGLGSWGVPQKAESFGRCVL